MAMRVAPDLVGHALDGRYELLELIGEGTFGRVYRGYDRRLEREVAIKVIKPWWSEDPEWAESFGREDLLPLSLVAQRAFERIHQLQRSGLIGEAPTVGNVI